MSVPLKIHPQTKPPLEQIVFRGDMTADIAFVAIPAVKINITYWSGLIILHLSVTSLINLLPPCLSFVRLPYNLPNWDTHTRTWTHTHTNTDKQMFHTVSWLIHAHCLIAGLWNLQVAGAKQFPNGCQAVAVTAGRDLPVIVEMMPFPLLIWYSHLCQWKKNTADSQSARLKRNNNASEWELFYCCQSLWGTLSKMLIQFSKLYLYAWFALSRTDTDTANVYICNHKVISRTRHSDGIFWRHHLVLDYFVFIRPMFWSPSLSTRRQLSWSKWHLSISQRHDLSSWSVL